MGAGIDLARLERHFKGHLVTPGQAAYDEARLIDNAAFDGRTPAVIAFARDTSDVAAAVRFARSAGLSLAVRSGGHSVSGHSTVDGALLLDVAALDSLHIDPQTRTALAGPGVRAADYTRAAHAHGLANSFGDTGSVGLGGLVLGGGVGWLARSQGLTIDSLLEVEIVTAAGAVVVANAREHPDLFWAVRGGGGNFGVATRYRFALHQLGEVLHGTLLLRATREILQALLALGVGAPDELTLMPAIMPVPAMDEVAEDQHGRLGVFVELLWAGSADAGQAAIAPLRALGPALLDTVAVKPYPAVYREPSGTRTAWTARSLFLADLGDATVEVLERYLAQAPPGDCLVQLRILGGAAGRVPADATAYGWRDRHLLAWLIASVDPADGARLGAHIEWIRQLRSALAERGDGNFVSFMAEDDPAAVAAAYPPATWARLRQVKRRYDPDNLFRHNHNIPPADDGA